MLLNVSLTAGSSLVTMPSFDPALFLRILKQHEFAAARPAARAAAPLTEAQLSALSSL